MNILLAEDEKTIAVTLGDDLSDAGHAVQVCHDGVEAWEALQRNVYDVLISDIRMPGRTGVELLHMIKSREPKTKVILITGYGDVESAVDAMKAGAEDYVRKPFLNEDILKKLETIQRLLELEDENRRLRSELKGRHQLGNLIGKSQAMRAIYETIETVAGGTSNILVTGETGTGKEMIADAIHHNSARAAGPMVKINCAVFTETLIEDELFGHEPNSFTGAGKERKIGRFEKATGGTLFIDELDDMPLSTQVKLLRVIQERQFERIGGTNPVKVDIRVVAATKKDLRALVREGRFREDLYYRFNVVNIELPPLRNRADDIPMLLWHFVAKHGGGFEYDVPAETLEAMVRYPWPGNVRELENSIERAIALAGKQRVLKKEHLLRPAFDEAIPARMPSVDMRSLKEVVAETEKMHIRHVLKHADGTRTRAADILGISRKNLWEKMKEYGLE